MTLYKSHIPKSGMSGKRIHAFVYKVMRDFYHEQ